MPSYTHLLVTVEAQNEAPRLLDHARGLAQLFGAKMTVLNVVEPMPMSIGGEMSALPVVDISREQIEQARKHLGPLCSQIGIPPDQLRVEFGGITRTILDVAKEVGADLIVVGHHRQSWLAALFSHTDDSVVSRAPCDVLAVALSRDDKNLN